MKRSRILMGLATLLLAGGAAIASAKTHAPNTYYYISGNTCLPVTVDFDCRLGGTGCETIIGGVSTQLYLTKPATGHCIDELQP